MGKPKGSVKTGGRVAGTPNKTNSVLREKIKQFGHEHFDEVIESWKAIIEPKDKIKAYIDIISFAIPKLQAVQMDANISHQTSVEDDLKALSIEETEST